MCSKQLSKDNAEYFVNVSYFLAAHIFKICMYLPYHTIQRYFNNNKFLESTFEMQVTFQQKIFMYLLQYLVMKTNLQSTNNPIYIPKPNDIKKKVILIKIREKFILEFQVELSLSILHAFPISNNTLIA